MSSHFTTKRPREEDSDPRPHSALTTRHASSKVESSPRLTVQAVAASTVVTSDFDDRILEVFLRGLLRMVAVSQRDAERTTAIIRDVVEVATAREMYVEVYGSARTGIVLPSSDLDFAIVPSSEQHSVATKRHGGGGDNEKRDTVRNSILGRATSGEIELRPTISSTSFAHLSKRERVAIAGQQLHAVVRALQNDRRFTRIRKILHAHVPIIKCVHRASNCEIDFSFTPDGIRSSDFIVAQLAAPELVLGRGLIIIIKSLLSQWSINDPSTGGLGSFPVALMVIWFLRSEGVHYEKGLKNSYAVHLLGFLKYYGEDFDYKNLAIDLVNMSTFKKYCKKKKGLKNSYAVHLLGFLKYYGEDFDYKNLAIDLVNMSTFKKYCTAEFMIMNPLDS
ncbi:DNA polymerase sigma-like protein, putative [Bodo saltans]|uniref:DNA polymerase sigma-like protein, putative n=1 Tax=Bodo saltans TaxID=75058 RepID=A0A0S4KLB7_BODSA|nr:DNA polymerase sigma-like protein, putative [Bodo saltans]|eukprot:CUI15271.1 DNA polymerase sigma-like protein, putative [Bodo saltans]